MRCVYIRVCIMHTRTCTVCTCMYTDTCAYCTASICVCACLLSISKTGALAFLHFTHLCTYTVVASVTAVCLCLANHKSSTMHLGMCISWYLSKLLSYMYHVLVALCVYPWLSDSQDLLDLAERLGPARPQGLSKESKEKCPMQCSGTHVPYT